MYKIILLLHQIFLYCSVTKIFYGLQSSLFACIYTAITLANFGFDDTLYPFFTSFSKSKKNFSNMILLTILHTASIVFIAIFFYLIYQYQNQNSFLHNISIVCNENIQNIIFLCLSIFILEAIKKTMITIMHLAFLNKDSAFAQIGMLTSYLIIFWLSYAWNKNISLYTILIPMACTSLGELCYITYKLKIWYDNLSDEYDPSAYIPFKVFYQQALYNYCNQITKVIYSSNIMTLSFSLFIGFEQAATIKFFTNLITLSYTCIAQSIGITSGTFFSLIKNNHSINIKKIFHEITLRHLQSLIIIGLLFIIILGFAWANSYINNFLTLQILLFISMMNIEQISIVYEQLSIAQEQSKFLALFHTVELFLLGESLYLYLYRIINLTHLIIILFIIKLLYIQALHWYTHKHIENNAKSIPIH